MPFDLDSATILPIVLIALGCNLIVMIVLLSVPARRRTASHLAWAGRAGLAEALGTFLLMFVAMLGLAQGPYVCGLLLMVLVAALGPTSGAHLNPAVTLGLMVVGRCHPLAAVWFVIAQVGGAAGAAAVHQAVFGPLTLPAVEVMAPAGVLLLEALGTGLLMLAIVGTACRDDASKAHAPLAIGAALTVALVAVGPHTGGVLNPARYLGPALVVGQFGASWLVYLTGPVLGALVAAALGQILMTEPPAAVEAPEPTQPRLYEVEERAAA